MHGSVLHCVHLIFSCVFVPFALILFFKFLQLFSATNGRQPKEDSELQGKQSIKVN